MKLINRDPHFWIEKAIVPLGLGTCMLVAEFGFGARFSRYGHYTPGLSLAAIAAGGIFLVLAALNATHRFLSRKGLSNFTIWVVMAGGFAAFVTSLIGYIYN